MKCNTLEHSETHWKYIDSTCAEYIKCNTLKYINIHQKYIESTRAKHMKCIQYMQIKTKPDIHGMHMCFAHVQYCAYIHIYIYICSVLHRVAVCCSVLQCVAVARNTRNTCVHVCKMHELFDIFRIVCATCMQNT